MVDHRNRARRFSRAQAVQRAAVLHPALPAEGHPGPDGAATTRARRRATTPARPSRHRRPTRRPRCAALYERGVRGSPLRQDHHGKSRRDAWAGKYLDVDANPYFQKALAAGFKPQNEQFMQEVLPGLDGRFAGSGRYGSGAHTGTTDRAVDLLNRAAGRCGGQGLVRRLRRRALAACWARPAPPPACSRQLQAADYQDINAMGQAGDRLGSTEPGPHRLRHRPLQLRHQQGLELHQPLSRQPERGLPRRRDERHGARLGDAGVEFVVGFARSHAQRRRLHSRWAMGTFLHRTSASRKTSTPVGALNDGQTVYSYRYKGDPRTQIGLLAQEVERLHPDAVTRHPTGVRWSTIDAPPGRRARRHRGG